MSQVLIDTALDQLERLRKDLRVVRGKAHDLEIRENEIENAICAAVIPHEKQRSCERVVFRVSGRCYSAHVGANRATVTLIEDHPDLEATLIAMP